MEERIQKIIANCGYCSRRDAEDLILQNKVVVKGKFAKIGESADIDKDIIVVEGKLLKKPEKLYFVLNKPEGYETTLNSPQKRRIVASLLKTNERVIPVGRLDMDSQGLLLMTNDGDFANKIMHPRYSLEKEYEATVMGKMPLSKIKKLEEGVKIKTGMTYPCKIKILKQTKGTTRVSVTIHEGKNRQIRRMFGAVGYEVTELKRTRIGSLYLGNLKPGKYRKLKDSEVKNLLNSLTAKHRTSRARLSNRSHQGSVQRDSQQRSSSRFGSKQGKPEMFKRRSRNSYTDASGDYKPAKKQGTEKPRSSRQSSGSRSGSNAGNKPKKKL